ncbi:hypothetical protein MRB53_018837 [Persea americana]|uniref:Uncharacterized protein n=1 Tax=Persea americana TaxID=3435 RepID=A0ACC2M983_PERAE|nr:hypothetical protein MRB53_018837 [Persea americana]
MELESEAIKAASEDVSQQFQTLIKTDDVDTLKHLQHLILGRLQDSNAVLSHFNEFSELCYAEVSGDLSSNTRLLKSMKADLDHIFQKLRLFPVEVRNNRTSGQIEFLGVSTCHVRHVLHISIELSSSCQKSTISYSVYGFL